MNVETINKHSLTIPADAFIVPCTSGGVYLTALERELAQEHGEVRAKLRKQEDFYGKLYETHVLYCSGMEPVRRVILVGMGKEEEIDCEKIRGAYARALRVARSLRLRRVVIECSYDYRSLSCETVLTCAIEGALLGHYRYLPYKTSSPDWDPDVEQLLVAIPDKATYESVKECLNERATICQGVCFARDLTSTPANDLTPTILSEKAKELTKGVRALKCRVLEREELEKLGMNAFLGVARGSHEPPKFIILEYKGTKSSIPPVVLIGKGLTFDSGGISLKPAEKMEEMKSDMAGAAAVMATIKTLAALRTPVNCVGLIAATENLPGGRALKPGDVLRSLSGKTIEVVNTDAEGRLTLADVLAYAARYQPAAVIDIATLTGACIVALGEQLIGLMGTDPQLISRLKEAGEQTGEFLWELPLWEPYDELIKSDIADVKNTGGRPAGTITAGLFLREFVDAYPWAHLDIAGAAWQSKDRPYIPKGASGIGVRLLVQFLRSRIAG